jgi:hypothetical protein
MPAGRPPLYETPEEMQIGIDQYYAECKENEEPLTVSGLAYTLGMSTETLRAYGEKDGFSATVNKAKQKVERSIESGMMRGLNATGCIFNLKNNFGWKDQTEQKINMGITDMTEEQLDAKIRELSGE